MAVMPDFPNINVQIDTQIPSKTYKLDLDKGRIVGYVDGEEALQQAAAKILYTPRFDCYAYDDQYGSEINSMLRNTEVSREYIIAEMEFILEETLCYDGRFLSIDDLVVNFDSDDAFFSFVINTVLGQTRMEGVSDYV